MKTLFNFVISINDSLLDLWLNSNSSLIRKPLGLLLWFIGLLMLPLNFIGAVVGVYLMRTQPLETLEYLGWENEDIQVSTAASTPITLIDGKYYEDIPF